jgi:hypothetical protein
LSVAKGLETVEHQPMGRTRSRGCA